MYRPYCVDDVKNLYIDPANKSNCEMCENNSTSEGIPLCTKIEHVNSGNRSERIKMKLTAKCINTRLHPPTTTISKTNYVKQTEKESQNVHIIAGYNILSEHFTPILKCWVYYNLKRKKRIIAVSLKPYNDKMNIQLFPLPVV